MHENNDHHLARAWWVIFNSPDLYFYNFPGGAKGPGIFFVIPCIDSYTKVDLRTVSFDVPPQEVILLQTIWFPILY